MNQPQEEESIEEENLQKKNEESQKEETESKEENGGLDLTHEKSHGENENAVPRIPGAQPLEENPEEEYEEILDIF